MSGFDKYLKEQAEKAELKSLENEINEFGEWVYFCANGEVTIDGHFTKEQFWKIARAMELREKIGTGRNG